MRQLANRIVGSAIIDAYAKVIASCVNGSVADVFLSTVFEVDDGEEISVEGLAVISVFEVEKALACDIGGWGFRGKGGVAGVD